MSAGISAAPRETFKSPEIVHAYIRMIPESFSVELVPWDEAITLSRTLAECIRGKCNPDLVIAIGRGGFVPARVVCDTLMTSKLTSIRVEHWGEAAECYKEARVRYPLSIKIDGQDVLVIDDVTDTGETLDATLEYLLSQNPGSVKTGVLHHKTTSSFIPDFYAKIVEGWHWIVYPWALHEDLTGFLERVMGDEPASMKKLQSALLEKYQMKPDEEELALAARELIALGRAEKTETGFRRKKSGKKGK